MKLSPIFSQRLEEATQLGKQEGYRPGRWQAPQEIIESLFKFKFGELDEKLEKIITAMIDFPAPDLTILILENSHLSSAELFAKFTSEN